MRTIKHGQPQATLHRKIQHPHCDAPSTHGMTRLCTATLISIGLCLSLSGCVVTASSVVDVTAEVDLRESSSSVQVNFDTPECERGRDDERQYFHICHVLLSPDRHVSDTYAGWIVRAVRAADGNVENPFLYFRGEPGENVEISVPGGIATPRADGQDSNITMWIQPGVGVAEGNLPGGTLAVHISGGCEPLYTPDNNPRYFYPGG